MIEVGDLVRFRNLALYRSPWIRRKDAQIFRGKQMIGKVLSVRTRYWSKQHHREETIFEVRFTTSHEVFLKDVNGADLVVHRKESEKAKIARRNLVDDQMLGEILFGQGENDPWSTIPVIGQQEASQILGRLMTGGYITLKATGE